MTNTTEQKPKRRIRQNPYGNWYGYEGNRRVIEFSNSVFGSQEEYANEWLAGKENEPDSLHSMRWNPKTTEKQ